MKREQILTEKDVKILLDAFKAPSFMLANINAGGKFIQANYGLTVIKRDEQYIAIIEK